MRLELQATPEEIREKSGQLLERLGALLGDGVPEFSEALEKALPAKEQELKYPVLRELAARSRELYAHQVDLMLQEILEVVGEAVGLQKADEEADLEKALYIGPKGGKWADPQHTKHWTPEDGGGGRQMAQAPEPKPEDIPLLPDAKATEVLIALGDELYGLQHGQQNKIDDIGFNHYDMGYWHSVRGNLSGMRKMLKKYKGQITSGHGALVYYQCGLHLVQKTEGLKIQPQYHDTFGSLMLPLDGFFKGDFKKYCSVVKEKYGAGFDGNKKCFYIPKLSLSNFDFAAYKADMKKFGIEVAEPIGTPPKAKAGGETYTAENVEELIQGIHAYHVKDTIVVRLREDGIFEFHSPYAPAFNQLFANKGGQLTGITKYNPVTKARETFDLDLTEEAIEKLKALFPNWKIVTQGVKEARIKRDQEIAELQKPIPEVQAKMNPKYKLMSYQNEAVRFLDKAGGNALIGDEMGLGKTLETLAWAAKNDKKVLIVCPKVVRRNWLEEAAKFFPEHFKGAELIASQIKKGQVPDLSGCNIATVNYESLSKFEDAIKAAGFDTLIIDESHRMKNPKAQATQNIQKIGAGMKHHILLSGTAIKNKKEELFTQLDLVAPGKFTKNAIKTAPIGGLWMDMHSVYLARAKSVVLKDLPEKTTSIIKHPVPGLPDMGNENTVGAISKLKAEIAKGKVPVTKDMVKEILETSDSRVIVFTDSVEAAKAIAEAFPKEALLHHGQMKDEDRQAVIKEFQKQDEADNFITEKRIFVTTRQSMAVGANLTAADKVIFNDLPWTAADVRQAEDRAHRKGQKNAVNVYWMTAEGNLFDENVNDILRRKYELGQKLNQGKQLSAAEVAWMSSAISIEELLDQIHGKAAGPKEGAGVEEGEEPPPPQVPATEDMAHPELAPPLPEPQQGAAEALPGSAVVIDVPLPEAKSVPEKPKEPAPALASEPAEAPPHVAPVVEQKPVPVKAPVAAPEPAPAPKPKPEHGSAPAQAPAHSFEAFLHKHGVKIREHKSDPSKVMIKVPKHETDALAGLKAHGIDEPSFEGGQYHLIAVAKQKVKDLLFGKSLAAFLEWDEPVQLDLFRLIKAGGPFIGPRGGKWADPEHTIPWQEPGPGRAPAAAPEVAEAGVAAPAAPPVFWNPKESVEPAENEYRPDPTQDADGDGVADAARVGVPAFEVPPPPQVPRLPNLTADERAMEAKFADAYQQNPQAMAQAFYDEAKKNHYVFETDAAKALMPEWSRPDLPPDQKGQPIHPERAQARAAYNTAMHQTANAVAKRAFLQRLDEISQLPADKRVILVTNGGVAGGKGSALAAKPELAQSVAATWDAAGEQNATENPWLLAECEKRGIKPVFLFVAADPSKAWPGAVERAKSIGRMVDARVFADSYAHGAKNFAAFHEKHKDRASFIFVQAAKGKPAVFLDGMPKEALSIDAEKTYQDCLRYIQDNQPALPPHIVAGATAGTRIWGQAQGGGA